MAPIYTAKHVSGSDKTTPLFALKGLRNLSPTTLTNSGISGVALEKQVAYTQYAASIPYFVKASVSNARVMVNAQPLGYLNTNRRLPLNPPPVHFTLQKEIPHEQSEKMVRTLGAGASKSKVGNTTIYQAPNLHMDVLTKILPVSSSHYNAGRDAVNPMGLKAFHLLSGAFSEILRVHTYSAFYTESEESMMEFKHLCYEPENISSTLGRGKNAEASRVEYSVALMQAAEQASGMEVDSGEVDPLEAAKAAKNVFTSTERDTVATAKPPRTPAVNIGSSSAIPQLPGILFPYFTGLTQPDPQMLTSFVIKHLFPLLGSTVQECQDTYSDLRRGFNSLATTDVGMTLSHIAFGIDLAIQTQGRCFVIVESNQYMGFSLLGARFAIFDSTRWVAPYDEKDLRSDLITLDPHSAAVGSLVKIFERLITTDIYSGPAVNEKTFDDPKDLIKVFEGLTVTQLGEEEPIIDRHLRSLNYMGDGYLPRNPQSVADVLETILSDTPVELSRPTYIPSIRSHLGTRSFICLSRFGPEAPSLWNERGVDYECVAKEVPAAAGNKRKMGDLDVYADMPVRLLITPKPLQIAVKDMEKVIERGAVRMDLKERAGKNRNVSVEAEVMKRRIWKILVEGLRETNSKRRRIAVEKKNNTAPESFDDALASLLG